MADIISLAAEPRERAGKGAARATRRAGRIPAVIYGNKETPSMVSIHPIDLMHQIRGGGFFSKVYEIEADGKKHRVLPRDIQLHPVTDQPIHVDFMRFSKTTRLVVEVPVDVGEGIRTASELSIWEQFSLAAFMQRHWADNQVSCTVTFDPKTEADEIAPALNYFQYHLKGISLLPRHDYGAYKQMPYEAIDEKTYNSQIKKLGKLTFGVIKNEEAEIDKFCNNDSCEIPGEEIK